MTMNGAPALKLFCIRLVDVVDAWRLYRLPALASHMGPALAMVARFAPMGSVCAGTAKGGFLARNLAQTLVRRQDKTRR